jgi:2-C-methyl-D-erythritol 2,4-cyclodiphosphate synthase
MQMRDRDRFDKFTERARKVLSLAREEAQRFNHNYLGTEHLLLGLVREGEGVAAKVLANLGVDLDKVRSAVEQIIGRGDRIVLGEVGLTPRAKKVIELAVDESRRLGHHYIGTEHLLLGLVREGEGIAAGVLMSLGVGLEDVRTQTVQVLSRSSSAVSELGGAAGEPGAARPAMAGFGSMMVPAALVREVARAVAKQQCLAFALDSRALTEGGRLVLAGVTFDEFPRGFDTRHGDGDVVARAVVMALLGATNKGEIDEWFPDISMRSIEYLPAIRSRLIEAENLVLGTVDVTILCGEGMPVRDHLVEMRSSIVAGLALSPEQVHVKVNNGGSQDSVEARALVSLWQRL